MTEIAPTVQVSVNESSHGAKLERINAGVGGVSGGTGLIALAQAIGTDTIAGQVIMYITPTVSAFIGFAVYLIWRRFGEYFTNREMEREIAKMRAQLADPDISESVKDDIRSNLEVIAQLKVNRGMARIFELDGTVGDLGKAWARQLKPPTIN